MNPNNTCENYLEWNPNNQGNYLTSEIREFNDRSMAFLGERSRELPATFSPHKHNNTIPREKAVLNSSPYASPHKGSGENLDINLQ